MQIWNKKDQNGKSINGDLDLSSSDDETENEFDNGIQFDNDE